MPMQPPAFIVFSREICPLCDEVERQLQQLGVTCQHIDIDADLQLLARYHESVPVVRHQRSSTELKYPFTYNELSYFVASISTQ